jgi:Fe-S-cluster containining protein
MRVSQERKDKRLVASVDRVLDEAARAAGSRLACRPGCVECCVGPFPVTLLDALRLRAGLARLSASEPSRAKAVIARASTAARLMAPDFPGDARRGILRNDDEACALFFKKYDTLSCPALDPETGLCELYAARPISCRTFGPPVRIGSELLPPCRVEFDPDCLEDALLGELECLE